MVDIEALAQRFSTHVSECRSAPVVCSTDTAVESWFRIELAVALVEFGTPGEQIGFQYAYPHSRQSADLMIDAPNLKAVFELKSFVRGADGTKLREFPRQLTRVRAEVERGAITQGVAFCTFIGYSDQKVHHLLDRFFPEPWLKIPVRRVVERFPLEFTLATFAHAD